MRLLFSIFLTCMVSFTFSFASDGRALYKKCKGCHGANGRHVPFERPNGVLVGRDAISLELILQAMKNDNYSGGKINKIMKKQIDKFSDEDILEISIYISIFKK